MNVEIRKGKGIEGLVADAQVEEVNNIAANPQFQEVEVLYLQRLTGQPDDLFPANVVHILTPEEINTFLQFTIKYEELRWYTTITGTFISHLIRNSHCAGHNNFQLNTQNTKEIDHLVTALKGIPEKRIEVTITGNVGNNCGKDSTDSNIYITGNAGNTCGYCTRDSAFEIKGDVGYSCGWGSAESTFNIRGDAGTSLGERSASVYTVHGTIGGHCGRARPTRWEQGGYANGATFKTPHKEALSELRHVPSGNRLILLHPDGSEEIIRNDR